jgi:ElaB/YqjD/DUF883 family membrane-anchored ribosome-binding protein
MTMTNEKRIEQLEADVKELKSMIEKLTNRRGPKSSREMTRDDAERIINGDLKETSHKKAAEILNLSYGQIYSARGGYTFKDVKKV